MNCAAYTNVDKAESDEAYIFLFYHASYGIRIGDVEYGCLYAFHFYNIGKGIAVIRVFAYYAHLVTQLAVRACYKYVHMFLFLGVKE